MQIQRVLCDQNGVNETLGGSGFNRHANNNGLTCIQEDESDELDNVVHVVSGIRANGDNSGAKSSNGDKGVASRVLPLLNFELVIGAPSNSYSSPVEKMARRTRSCANSIMLDSSVDFHGHNIALKHAQCCKP